MCFLWFSYGFPMVLPSIYPARGSRPGPERGPRTLRRRRKWASNRGYHRDIIAGCCLQSSILYFLSIQLGIIIPADFHIFQIFSEGWLNHQPEGFLGVIL